MGSYGCKWSDLDCAGRLDFALCCGPQDASTYRTIGHAGSAGHLSAEITRSALAAQLYWEDQEEEVHSFVALCSVYNVSWQRERTESHDLYLLLLMNLYQTRLVTSIT